MLQPHASQALLALRERSDVTAPARMLCTLQGGDLRERLWNDPAGELRWYCKGKGGRTQWE